MDPSGVQVGTPEGGRPEKRDVFFGEVGDFGRIHGPGHQPRNKDFGEGTVGPVEHFGCFAKPGLELAHPGFLPDLPGGPSFPNGVVRPQLDRPVGNLPPADLQHSGRLDGQHVGGGEDFFFVLGLLHLKPAQGFVHVVR
mgnify:CR=1 FL=1